jgi:TPR repeat protein
MVPAPPATVPSAAPAAATTAPAKAQKIATAVPPPPLLMLDAVPAAKPKPAASRLPKSATEALVRRGDALLATGDVTSARLFYRRGADGGDGTAALRLGETFDPVFLAQAGLSQIPGDAKQAAHWYRQARSLGVRDAALLLEALKPAMHR